PRGGEKIQGNRGRNPAIGVAIGRTDDRRRQVNRTPSPIGEHRDSRVASLLVRRGVRRGLFRPGQGAGLPRPIWSAVASGARMESAPGAGGDGIDAGSVTRATTN